MDTERGLYPKYTVQRNDGRDLPGGDRAEAVYLVMDYRFDPFAWVSVASYAVVCAETHPALARDVARRLLAVLPRLREDAAKARLLDKCFEVAGHGQLDGSEVWKLLVMLACAEGGPLVSLA